MLILLLWIVAVFLWSEYSESKSMTLDEQKIWKSISEVYIAWSWEQHIWWLQTYAHADGSMRYLDTWPRDGEVIVLLHGTPTSSYLWRKIIPWLVEAWHRVIAPDALWYWASDKPKWKELYSIKKQSERMLSLLSYLDVDTFVLWWHDQWSLWMRDIATNFSEKVSKLVIFNSIFEKDGFNAPSMYWKESLFTKTMSSIRWNKLLWKTIAEASFGWWVVDEEIMTEEVLQWYLIPLYEGAHRANYYFISDFEAVFVSLEECKEKFSDIDTPATIIWWEQDSILLADKQIPVLQQYLDIKQEDIHILQDAKHFIQEEQPEEIVNIINKFLAQ